MREEIEKYQSKSNCSKCKGYRLKEEALCVKINKSNIGYISTLTIDEALKWFEDLPSKLSKKDTEISKNVIKEIRERLNFLKNV
jgi:excinuclease ABC subunit A